MNRRTLILGASALPLLAVAGCVTAPTASQLQTDVTLIANGLSGITSALAALPNSPVPASTLAQINAEIATVKADAAAIASAGSSTTLVTGLTAAVQAIVPLVTPFFPAAPLVAGVVQAAVSLISTVLAQAGIAGAAVGAPVPTMSPAQARLVLAKGA